MRRLENYVRKYGPEAGPKLFHALQSQAAHAGVSARLRKKIDVLEGRSPALAPVKVDSYPLFEAAREVAKAAPDEAQLVA
ncbi:hypothetical protein [Planctomyces sp. SH-PL62]|uniref:hypothetical protein n=1 Tax=Planctomyces sp. SH-PL62 TaxID=1636152 RepID=UPI00078E04D1|nr:hypothetical protein [Planctomyces sp. SH-PL62]AMV40885.1 hypothetical protein VT85_25855 [Planctomyces sp. SH-PL62]